jgi:hypothetical protein
MGEAVSRVLGEGEIVTNNAMPWFRLYSEAINDPKVTRLCLKTKLPKYAILGAITSLLCIANQSPVRGKLMMSENEPLTLEEILIMCGMGEEGEAIIKAMLEMNVLTLEDGTYQLTHWEKRQAPSESAERVRRYRERKKQDSNVTVTEQVTPLVTTVTGREEEKRGESPLTPQNGGNREGVKKLDPVKHALDYNGKLSPTATEPDEEFERLFGKYRVEALKIFEQETGIPLNEGRRYEITELARAPDFNLEIFEDYTHQYNISGGNPYKIADFCKGYGIYKRTGDIVAAISGEQQENSGEVWTDPETGIEVRW